MTDQESGKHQLKGNKKANDSDLFTYISKLEQQVIQKRTLIVKERRKFQSIIQSLAKYLDMRGISANAVEEFLNSLSTPTNVLQDDDIADWYNYLESKNESIKKVIPGPSKYSKIFNISNHPTVPSDQQKTSSSNIIRITKQDLSQQTNYIPKPNKKIKMEDTKQQPLVEVQTKLELSENNSIQEVGDKINKLNNEQAESTKLKRKRRTKQEMLESKLQENQGTKGQQGELFLITKDLMNSSHNSVVDIPIPQIQLNPFLPGFKSNGYGSYTQMMQEKGLFDLTQIDGFNDHYTK